MDGEEGADLGNFIGLNVQMIRKKEPRLAKILSLSKPMGCRQVVEMMYDVQVKQAKELLDYFVDNQFDVLIMPGFALPAPKLGEVAVFLCL